MFRITGRLLDVLKFKSPVCFKGGPLYQVDYNHFHIENSSLNLPDKNGYTPMHNAALHGKILPMIELHRAGAAIDIKGPNYKTPLHLAISSDIVPSIEYFIGLGAVVDEEIVPVEKSAYVDYLLAKANQIDELDSYDGLTAAYQEYAVKNLPLFVRCWYMLCKNHMELTEEKVKDSCDQIQSISGVRVPLQISEGDLCSLLGGITAYNNHEFDGTINAGA